MANWLLIDQTVIWRLTALYFHSYRMHYRRAAILASINQIDCLITLTAELGMNCHSTHAENWRIFLESLPLANANLICYDKDSDRHHDKGSVIALH